MVRLTSFKSILKSIHIILICEYKISLVGVIRLKTCWFFDQIVYIVCLHHTLIMSVFSSNIKIPYDGDIVLLRVIICDCPDSI